MGITNLLKELKPITKSVPLSDFSGQKCGVDASCWLHRASHSCALDLVTGQPTNRYLQFTLRCIKVLLECNITPIIVFDGAELPMKANEEHRRNQIREDKKKETLQHIQLGNSDLAWKSAQAAVRITKEMVTGFINQCIEHNIQFICAPYEADSQLGYMYKNNQIDFVITEDSDLLLFGVHKALYKFDPNKKCGQLINMNDIYNYTIDTNLTDKKKKTDLCLFLKTFWTKDPKEFIQVCVLSGCDYVKNLAGIGIKTAVKYCNENRNIQHLLEKLMIDKVNTAPKDYIIQFKRAVLTFLHQRIYDINKKKLVHLNPLTSDINIYLIQTKENMSKQDANAKYDIKLDFLGKSMEDNMASKIATGMIDARELMPRNLVSFDGISMEVDSKEQSDIVLSSDEDEFVDLRLTIFSLRYWKMLWKYDPDLYHKRYKITQKQEQTTIWQKWTAVIHRIEQNGNCACVAMLKDLGIEINPDTLMVIRKLLNKYCQKKIPQFALRFGNGVEKFIEDKILLEEDHYYAYGQLFCRNVVILEYHEKHNDYSMKIWFDSTFKHSLYLLYHQIPNSETNAGHLDYVAMPELEFDFNNLELKNGFNYIDSKHHEKCLALHVFDIKNKLPSIVLDHSPIYQSFGNDIGIFLINSNLFPIKHLLDMAQTFHLSATDFDGIVDAEIGQICDYMNRYYDTPTIVP